VRPRIPQVCGGGLIPPPPPTPGGLAKRVARNRGAEPMAGITIRRQGDGRRNAAPDERLYRILPLLSTGRPGR